MSTTGDLTEGTNLYLQMQEQMHAIYYCGSDPQTGTQHATNGQVLTYNNGNSRWEAQTIVTHIKRDVDTDDNRLAPNPNSRICEAEGTDYALVT